MEAVLNIDEAQIIQKLEGPDIDEAVKQLYKLYFFDVADHITYRGGNKEDAADIFQESVIVLIDKIRNMEFRRESSLKTFLRGIAKNLWTAEQRGRDRRKQREEEYTATEEWIEDPDTWRIPVNEIMEVIEKVGDTCKNILIGFYYENKNMKTLLHEFDFKNEQVLRNRKAICMKRLREMIQSNKALMQSLLKQSHYENRASTDP
jgi:RNA polymerase sigma factor (sigma-70 family)